MRTIPILEPNGEEPLPICRHNRDWLVSRYRVEAVIALKYLSDEPIVSDSEKDSDSKAVDHIRKCPKCRAWVHHVVPKDIFIRQSRMVKYCCSGMFVACEEYKERDKNRITFDLYRGEDPCWMIDGKRSFISFCPWCGKKLPERPFIEE